MVQQNSYYEILNVLPGSSWKKIDRAYHREKKNADAERLKELKEAYEVLSDDKKRRVYDAELEKRPYTMEDLNRLSDEFYKESRVRLYNNRRGYFIWFITGGFMEEKDSIKIFSIIIGIILGLLVIGLKRV